MSYHFYRKGVCLFVGETRFFWGGQRGGPVFFQWAKGGTEFLRFKEGGGIVPEAPKMEKKYWSPLFDPHADYSKPPASAANSLAAMEGF